MSTETLRQPHQDPATGLLVVPVGYLAIHQYVLRASVYRSELQVYQLSLGGEGALVLGETDGYSAPENLAEYAATGILAPLVSKTVASVLVESRLSGTLRRVEEERQGVGGSLADVVHLGP